MSLGEWYPTLYRSYKSKHWAVIHENKADDIRTKVVIVTPKVSAYA